MNKQSIHISEVLAELDEKVNSLGEQKTFSIGFILASGEYRFINRAVSCGLKMNMKANRKRGVRAVDSELNKQDHPTPVGIFDIVKFNGRKVYL